MADDSIEIIEPIDYHPCNTPRGSLYYNVNILTPDQQIKLNELKIETIKSDEKYLNNNPEIRAFIALILRYVLKHKPRRNVLGTIQEFFQRPRENIEKELTHYISQMKTTDSFTKIDMHAEKSLSGMPSDFGATTSMQYEHSEYCDESESTAVFIRNLISEKIATFPSQTKIPKVERKTTISRELSIMQDDRDNDYGDVSDQILTLTKRKSFGIERRRTQSRPSTPFDSDEINAMHEREQQQRRSKSKKKSVAYEVKADEIDEEVSLLSDQVSSITADSVYKEIQSTIVEGLVVNANTKENGFGE